MKGFIFVTSSLSNDALTFRPWLLCGEIDILYSSGLRGKPNCYLKLAPEPGLIVVLIDTFLFREWRFAYVRVSLNGSQIERGQVV